MGDYLTQEKKRKEAEKVAEDLFDAEKVCPLPRALGCPKFLLLNLFLEHLCLLKNS